MYIRSTAVLFALTLLGCHGSDYKPPATSANGINPPAYPQEMTSTGGGRIGAGEGSRAAQTTTPNTNMPASPPPPLAGTSSPTPNNPVNPSTAPYKPGAQEPPAATGGGPKSETGGAVYGDGNEGNTGAVKGGVPK